jgi:hypothetical protein
MVVFIDNITFLGFPGLAELTVGKVYHIVSISDSGREDQRDTIRVTNDKGHIYGYYASRFISLSESRKLKLNKLKSL